MRVSAQKQRVIVPQLHGGSGKAAAGMTKVAGQTTRVYLMLTFFDCRFCPACSSRWACASGAAH